LHLKNVLFDNCTLEFPSMTGQALANQKALLAALISSNAVTININE
jgi:hypothetical protein